MARKEKGLMRKRALIVSVVVAAMAVSCTMFEYEAMVVAPPGMPGATYVGSEMCAACHEREHKYFQLADHASVAIKISEDDAEAGQAEGCETCHGPGSLHAEEYGDKTLIVRSDPETCFSCHLNIKGKFMLQHHHPVREGIMTCSDCHSMHGRDVRATGRQLLLGSDEKCFKCHKDQKGPWVFVHDAMRDGCSSCHNPHGSINDKLLVAGQSTTCIRCHWQPGFNSSQARVGAFSHGFIAAIGNGAECVDCHAAPHGSNISRSLRR